MDFRQLKHLVALAESGSYAKAAEKVHLSQSALSRSIQQLELQLGFNLFERGRFGATLTAHGEAALPHIRGLIAAEDSLKQTLAALSGLKMGQLTIGAGPYPSIIFINKTVALFSDQYPDIQLTIKTDNWANLKKQLFDNKIDLFIADIRELRNDPLLAIHELSGLAGVAFCRTDHPLSAKQELKWGDLLNYPLAMPKLSATVEQVFQSASQPFGGLKRRIECDNISMLLEIVMQSSAFSIAPYPVITEYVEAGKLRPLKIAELPTLFTAFGVVTRQQKQLSPAATAFTQLLLEYVARD